MASLLPKAAEVGDLACKDFRVINQRPLGRNALPAAPVLSPQFALFV